MIVILLERYWKLKEIVVSNDSSKPTVAIEGRHPPRVGNIGHLTRISNKLVHLGNMNSELQAFFQENKEWIDWCSNVLSKRNAVENVYQWVCGRPTALQDRTRDSDDDDYQDRDYDVAALANNLSQAFHYGIYSNDMEEVQASLERDEEAEQIRLPSLVPIVEHSLAGEDCRPL
ncbi:DNA polymerase IV [Bienertia sinuspersici]